MSSVASFTLLVVLAAAPPPSDAPVDGDPRRPAVSQDESAARSTGPTAAWTVAVPSRSRTVETRSTRRLTPPLDLDFEVPTPARHRPPSDGWLSGLLADGWPLDQATEIARSLPSPALSTVFDSTDFDANQAAAGLYQTPPDAHGAAGPDHLVNVVNSTLRIHAKDGTLLHNSSLASFFAALSPQTKTFDPKVLYDAHDERWLVVTLERLDFGADDPGNRSSILLAVSDDADPTGVWYAAELPGRFDLSRSYWTDYPGFAIDDEAIYLTGNLFAFGAFPWPDGNRLWIVDKGLTDGFYAGGDTAFSIVDPRSTGAIGLPAMPARVHGTNAARGTWLVSYSGLNTSGLAMLQLVRVDDPLGMPALAAHTLDLGTIDVAGTFLPDAPQTGSTQRIEVNDRRSLDAVWRGDDLWTVFTVHGPAATADAGQSTVYWLRIDTSDPTTPVLADGGPVGAEDLAVGSHTFFPSVDIDADGRAVIGFAASAPTLYGGAYFATRTATDPAGTVGPTHTVRAGVDSYVRTFGAGLNRWGDYSATVLEPTSGCFWLYGQYAMARGTPLAGEDGRWSTTWGEYCPPSDPTIFTDGFELGDLSAWAPAR
ncbi:MAG: hypothetical protein AAGE94_02875 [Acidobacteriota bacterium]